VLDILFHHNIRLSYVSVSDILDSDQLPIVFHILDLVTTNKLLEPPEKWEWFQILASNLISARIEINSGAEPNKAAREFTASIASEYQLLGSKVKLYELNHDLPGLDRLLKNMKKLRKLRQEMRDQECKRKFSRLSKMIRCKACKRGTSMFGNQNS
jgi:hypothetical protein